MTNDDNQIDDANGRSLPPPPPPSSTSLSAAPLSSPPVAGFGALHTDRFSDTVRRLFEHDGTAVATLALDGTIRDLSRPMLDLIGASSVIETTPGSDADAVLRSFLDHLPTELFRDGRRAWHGRVDHRDASGRQLVFEATASVHHDDTAPGGGDLALLMHDITASDRQMRDLLQRATHDPLTGLANRHQLMRQLAQAIDAHGTGDNHVAVLFVDLDGLQYVNDAFGHAAGDRLLMSSARRLEQAMRPSDHIGRVGGDQFVAIAAGMNDAPAALEVADRARRSLTGSLRIGALDLDLSVSVGVAVTDDDLAGLSPDDAASTLISNANAAMNQSKRDGRDRCTLFTSEMRSTAREHTSMARALNTAITDGDLTVDYQTIHSAMSGVAVGVEALVRWTHPTIGRVDAATVIDVAEASGSIGRLGELVLGQALTDLEQWRADAVVDASFAVHVNVSRLQLASSSFVNLVAERLRHHRLDPAQLVLEARESPVLGREADVVRSIRALRRLGVQIAIDNFGTGAKALSVLTDVGADILKLDGSLALPSGASDADVRLVRAVVLLAHALDIDVVAQRVHGQAQLARLQAAGCDLLQGNVLSTPAPAGAVDFARSPLV